jgi:hypothetical protein
MICGFFLRLVLIFSLLYVATCLFGHGNETIFENGTWKE